MAGICYSGTGTGDDDGIGIRMAVAVEVSCRLSCDIAAQSRTLMSLGRRLIYVGAVVRGKDE